VDPLQIIIPMSGFGVRFQNAGYNIPKPLIEIEGKPIIAHVIDMFPGEENFIFICNQDHLYESTYRMEEILIKYCPNAKIVGIPPHKLGPMHAILSVEKHIERESPVIVNYCDFTCYWNWGHFKSFLNQSKCKGAIPAYKGFHPHSLGNTNYAYIKETDGWIDDIQEKQPFTNNRMEEYASSGTYYFDSGSLMVNSFKEAIKHDLNIGGEFYVSLAYKALFTRNLPVAVYPIQHFMQWGTPEDVTEYMGWSKAFKGLINKNIQTSKSRGALVIPMAGLGKRFKDDGYEITKPLIQVSGKSMVVQATYDLPQADQVVFVVRSDMYGYSEIKAELQALYPSAIIKTINNITQGQACTALFGLIELKAKGGEVEGPITIGACDSGVLYNKEAFEKLVNNNSIDIIVWGIRAHPSAIRNPNMYGWIDAVDGEVKKIAVKTPLKNPDKDPIVLGVFTFRNSKIYKDALEKLIERDGRVNGEFYIDSLINDAINLGMRCCLFEVDSFLCWGTPNDLRTFEYWQSCLHKWDSHPYSLELDVRVSKQKVSLIKTKYATTFPEVPRPR
jgi:NDP-sugar pyrophosphorylase family protein